MFPFSTFCGILNLSHIFILHNYLVRSLNIIPFILQLTLLPFFMVTNSENILFDLFHNVCKKYPIKSAIQEDTIYIIIMQFISGNLHYNLNGDNYIPSNCSFFALNST